MFVSKKKIGCMLKKFGKCWKLSAKNIAYILLEIINNVAKHFPSCLQNRVTWGNFSFYIPTKTQKKYFYPNCYLLLRTKSSFAPIKIIGKLSKGPGNEVDQMMHATYRTELRFC